MVTGTIDLRRETPEKLMERVMGGRCAERSMCDREGNTGGLRRQGDEEA
jgi:hypothetical protein